MKHTIPVEISWKNGREKEALKWFVRHCKRRKSRDNTKDMFELKASLGELLSFLDIHVPSKLEGIKNESNENL